jgi:hypothetical protein
MLSVKLAHKRWFLHPAVMWILGGGHRRQNNAPSSQGNGGRQTLIDPWQPWTTQKAPNNMSPHQ